MTQLTTKERETLRKLQAKAKAAEREEKKFLEQADARKDELLKRWGISDDLGDIARIYYDTDKQTLRRFITDSSRVEYFKRHCGGAEGVKGESLAP